MRSVTVPGNLLITGEYVITEEGGTGFACAMAPRVEAWMEDAPDLQVEGRAGGSRISWSASEDAGRSGSAPGASVSSHLLDRAVPFLLDHGARHRKGRLVVDSSAFFARQGRKLGFGSSAAVTLALTALLAAEPQTPPEEILHTAVSAHRHVQGGRGSGYDVTASLFGGVGIFTGGSTPGWTAAEGWWLANARLILSERHNSTVDAVKRHRSWSREHPDAWQELIQRSNAATDALASAAEWSQVRTAIHESRRIGGALGEAIGVSACVDDAAAAEGSSTAMACKSVGAGSELMLCLRAGDAAVEAVHVPAEKTQSAHIVPLMVEQEGLRWE